MNGEELRESVSALLALEQDVHRQLKAVGPVFVSQLRKAGETYASLGEIAGVSRQYLCNIEKGDIRISGNVFSKLYDRFGGVWIDS